MLQNRWNYLQSGKVALPSLVTLAGLALGVVGVRLRPSPAGVALLVAGWALDGVDGALARRLDAVTARGGAIDLAADVGLAWLAVGVLVARHPAWCVLVLPLVAVQVAARERSFRCSGRSVMTVVLVALGVAHASA